jgi:hypothetical protein
MSLITDTEVTVLLRVANALEHQIVDNAAGSLHGRTLRDLAYRLQADAAEQRAISVSVSVDEWNALQYAKVRLQYDAAFTPTSPAGKIWLRSIDRVRR